MKYLRLRRIAITILLLGVICILLSLTACGSTLNSVKSMLNRKYNVKLPSDTQLVYCHYESKDSFHGDGADYFVFKFKKEPTGVIANFKSLNLKDGENPDELKNELIEFFNSAISLVNEIPQEYLPDWDSEMIWNYGGPFDGLSAIYYPESMEMIVCIITT